MPDSIPNALIFFTGGVFALALLLFLVSFRLFRRSRTDVFWRRRREAGQRGWRLFLLSVMLFIISGLSCLAILVLASVADDTETDSEGTPTAGQVLTSSLTPPTTAFVPSPEDTTSPTPTDTPTMSVVIITTTPVHTPTDTPFPTFTPNITPLVSSVTPDPMAEIRIVGLDDQISDDLMPVDPRTAFEAGITRLYMFVTFRNMTPGVLWHRNLYHNGELVDSSSYLWGLETEGNGYFFFGNDSGFEPGTYEIRLYIGSSPEPVSGTQFTISEAPQS